MKGKRTLKRVLAMVMAVVFTVCGITFTPSSSTEVKAGTAPTSGWTELGGWNIKTSAGGTYSGGTSSADLTGFVYTPTYADYGTHYLEATPNTTYTAGTTYDYSIKLSTANAGIGKNNIWLMQGATKTEASSQVEALDADVAAGGNVDLVVLGHLLQTIIIYT